MRDRALRSWLLLAGASGLAFVLALPPFLAPDEPVHFLRAFQISEGRWLAEVRSGPAGARVGGHVPSALLETIREAGAAFQAAAPPAHRRRAAVAARPLQAGPGRRRPSGRDLAALAGRPLLSESRVFVDFPNLAPYSPVCYAPQAAGLALARLAGGSPLALFYAGRLAGLAAWLLLATLALARLPAGRLPVMLATLLPAQLAAAAALSADGMASGLALLLAALCLEQAAAGPGPPRPRALAALAATAVLAALAKAAYAPLAVLVLAIPARRFGGRRRKLLAAGAIVLAAAVAVAGWLALAGSRHVPYRDYDPVHRDAPMLAPEADPAAQLRLLIRAPWLLAGALARTLAGGWRPLAGAVVSGHGHLGLALPAAAAAVWLLALPAAARLAGGNPADRAGRAVLAAAPAAALVWMALLLYAGGSAPGAPRVAGLQGRYFLPLLPPLLLALVPGRRPPPALTRLAVPAGLAAGAGLAAALGLVLARYWLP